MSSQIDKVLIANRGEIAVRIARTLREMDIASVAVYSEADEGAPHVRACDEAVEIGPAAAAESYLRADVILDAARKTGAQAIHPGYGFLSERADFAEACEKAGIIFIGPGPAAIRLMGSKNDARITAEEAGVPVVPGSRGALNSDEDVLAIVEELGVPVMLKAAAGGGGKGMRRIESPEGLSEQVASARREAEAAFGDGSVLVEKLLDPVRHVEVQVIGDHHGNVFAIGERECSMQRRFQKILEEAPSPVVDAELRTKMLDSARKLTAAAGYVNAGTVEFLLAPDGHFYFLEMNTRLQVEHPVTEFVTGLDLVRLQLEVARGEKLALPELPPRGHSIEARVYAENPDAGFLPTSGELLRLSWPEGVRVDHGLAEGGEVSPHYDPLIAKVISWGPDREHARRRLVNALKSTVLLGVHTNLNFLIALLETREFREGDMSTGSLPDVGETEITPAVWAVAASLRPKMQRTGSAVSPFDRIGHWRVGP